MAYKRQMEIYQWLVRQKGLKVSDTDYFVYCNGQDAETFDARIEFAVKLLPYTGSDHWIEQQLFALKQCLAGDATPDAPQDCEFCGYVEVHHNLRFEP